ncbi:VanZ family protein [Neobacillus muris]|uniref:VanZ family protein n=1 Tax=Neobacillus muris TaxID=2941334 RepID=UPI00203E7CEC|nr:VanZ family protein [Neobacillus muris]
MTKQKKWAIAAIVWMICIFCFTQLPYFTGENTSKAIHKVVETEHKAISTPNADNHEVGILNLALRKSTHFLVFGLLAFLLFKSLEAKRFSYLLAWLITFFYAMTDEYHQSFRPGRVSSFRDVLIDSFGAFIFLTVSYLVNRRMKAKTH